MELAVKNVAVEPVMDFVVMIHFDVVVRVI